jgi:hypothetical protein
VNDKPSVCLGEGVVKPGLGGFDSEKLPPGKPVLRLLVPLSGMGNMETAPTVAGWGGCFRVSCAAVFALA